MQRVKAILLALSVGICAGCSESAEPKKVTATPPSVVPVQSVKPWAVVHFIGTEAMKGDTNNASFLELWALPTSAKLTEHILTRFAEAAPVLTLGGTNKSDAKLKPLLEKALARDVWFSVPSATSGWTLALNLPPADVVTWTNALAEILTAAGASQPASVSSSGYMGWAVKSGDLTCSVIPAQDWLVIQGRASAQGGLSNLLAAIKSTGRPAPALTNGWLQVSADLASVVSGTNAPYASLNWSTRGGLVRTRGTLSFGEGANWTAEKWRIPKEIIEDPLVSFTAGQGLARFVNQTALAKKLEWPTEANQFYGWSQDGNPFLVTVAVNCADAGKAIEGFGGKLSNHVNQEILPLGMTPSNISTNDGRFLWPGFPFIVPYIKPTKTSAGDFLVAGIFPLENNKKTPAPPELFEQVESRTNLVYYDWEITAIRTAQWQNTFQVFSMLTSEMRYNTKTPGQQWLTEVSPHLGNSVTEISVSSLRELTLVRSSHIGLTSVELVNLMEWVDEKRFPLAEYRLPFQPLGAGVPSVPKAP